MKLTQASVARLKLPGGKSEHIEFDETMPGFGVRIRASTSDKPASRTYVVQYKIGKANYRHTLGNVAKVSADDARKAAKRIFGKLADGQNPAAERKTRRKEASDNLGGLIAEYLAARETALRPRSLLETKRHLNKHFKPLHGSSLAAVNRDAVARQLRAIATSSGNVAANRARASLSALFRWAIGEGRCDANPVIGTNKQTENKERDRSLSDAEIAAIWLAAPDNDYGRIVRLATLTGCRRTELGDLQWPEIDLKAKTITLPAERTKNKTRHVVPLCAEAVKILEAIPRREGRAFVFGSRGGGFSDWSGSKADLDAAVKLDAPWTFHDIRRTVRTGLGRLSVLPHVAEAVVNHLPPRIVRTYDTNTYEAEKRKALETWATHLAVAVAQASGDNVTKSRSKKFGFRLKGMAWSSGKA